jgi:hypothetical protein
MANSPFLDFTLLTEGQYQKEITVNNALIILELIAAGGVIDRDLTAPPGSESEGDAYLVADSATGDWSGHDGKIAIYLNGGYFLVVPVAGLRLYVQDENVMLAYNGTSWQTLEITTQMFPITDIVGTTHTATASNLGALIQFDSASACTLTLPQASTEALQRGFQCMVRNKGAGTLDIALEGTDTIEGGTSVNDPNLITSIILETAGSPNNYIATGDLT